MVTPGELVIEPPTLINLGFEWFIQGDANRNAAVEVSYRKKGAARVEAGAAAAAAAGRADLRRVARRRDRAEHVRRQHPRSRTGYGLRGALRDVGSRWRARAEPSAIVTVRTRAEPQPYAGGRVFHVYPHGFNGQKIEPSFEGLMCAYNYWCAGTDWATSGRPRVRPGDTILVHAGIYQYNRYEYTNNATVNRTVPLDGTYYLTADGTPEHADRDQGGRRRRGGLRRRRQLRALRREGGRLHLLRRADVPERRGRDSGGHAVHRRREGADGQEEPLRERRRRRLHQLRRLEQLLHRRQHVHRPQRSESPDRLGGRHAGRSSTASKDRSSRRRWRRTSR